MSIFKSFEVGVVCLPSGENDLHAVEWCDMKLYQHGENGDPPADYAFQFQAGGVVYTVEVINIFHVHPIRYWLRY